jgi:hypothetical protein
VEQCPGETNNYYAVKKCSYLLCTCEADHSVSKCLLLVPILSQVRPVDAFMPDFVNICVILILSSAPQAEVLASF